MDDGRIIELFYERREEAIKILSEKYGKGCKKIANNILKNELDAEECVNDALLAVWNTVPPQNPDPLQAYLFRIVRNTAIARYHKNTSLKRNSHYDLALEELEGCIGDAITLDRELEAAELSLQIERFLDGLSEENRIVFVRRYWFSDSVFDIAERLKLTPNNVSVRLSRIREKLKKHLKKEGFEL